MPTLDEWRRAFELARVPVFCSTYDRLEPCRQRAVGWLYAPDGKAVPGASGCWQHLATVVIEYQEKLGQTWTVVPINEHLARTTWEREQQGG